MCQADISLRLFTQSPLTTSSRQSINSAADHIPTFVLKNIVDLIVPFVSDLYNRSLTIHHFPTRCKEALSWLGLNRFKETFITLIVKKLGLDSANVNSYRPIRNLTVLSKLLKRLIVHNMCHFLIPANLLPSLQSGFHPGHSNETAILHVTSELRTSPDHGDFTALALLDISAAFNTVVYSYRMTAMQTSFGIDGPALKWFQSNLLGTPIPSISITAPHVIWFFIALQCSVGLIAGSNFIHLVHCRPRCLEHAQPADDWLYWLTNDFNTFYIFHCSYRFRRVRMFALKLYNDLVPDSYLLHAFVIENAYQAAAMQ